MSGARSGVLYSPKLLALAVELADYPFEPDAPVSGEARSRSCGSIIQLSSHADGRSLGMRVQACAVGQAAAAIFARHADGKEFAELERALDQIETWLAGGADQPEWPDISLLENARGYPGRHGAILLPWRAALDALSNRQSGQ